MKDTVLKVEEPTVWLKRHYVTSPFLSHFHTNLLNFQEGSSQALTLRLADRGV